MKLEFSREIFNVVPCGWTDGLTDMTKLIVAFRNFATSENKTDCRGFPCFWMASADWFREHGCDASVGKIDRFNQRPQHLKREAERDGNARGKVASPRISPVCLRSLRSS